MGEVEWTLWVEGIDDKHAIHHLLSRHGLGDSVIKHVKVPKKEGRDEGRDGGKAEVLRTIRDSVRTGTRKSVGFILDANGDADGTWRAAASRLRRVGVDVPKGIPAGGYVGESEEFRTRVGVWIMPDNRRSGALEDFLRDLIVQGDKLINHAESSTERAREIGALFNEQDFKKAVLHTWLAWQEMPGRPYGTAINACYFGANSAAAGAFVSWFRKLLERTNNGVTGHTRLQEGGHGKCQA